MIHISCRSTMSYFCCNISRRGAQKLKNITERRFTIENPYVILTAPMCTEAVNEDIQLQNSRFFRVKCNYNGFDASELSFDCGDIVEVEDAFNHHYLYMAKHMRLNKVGRISKAHFDSEPIIELQPWYFHHITRDLATKTLLQQDTIGTFLVRSSKDNIDENHVYTLSVLDFSKENHTFFVRHYKIYFADGFYYISKNFASEHLDLLIKHYEEDQNAVLGLTPQLTGPCPKDSTFTITLSDLIL